MTARLEAKIEANNKKFEVLSRYSHLPNGYPRSQDRSHARINGCQTKRREPAKTT
jgi:hypothetical protein